MSIQISKSQFGANGFRIVTAGQTATLKEGYTVTNILARTDVTISGTAEVGDDIPSSDFLAGDMVFAPLKEVVVTTGTVWIYATGDATDCIELS